jgi:hypothetical protein
MVVARQAPPLIVPRCIVELGLQDLLSALETHAVVTDMIVEEVKKQGLAYMSFCAHVLHCLLLPSSAPAGPSPYRTSVYL